jgi:competence protein ComEC
MAMDNPTNGRFMRSLILCFAAGTAFLQMQATLPQAQGWWLVVPVALPGLLFLQKRLQIARWLCTPAAALLCFACGFGWAAWLAGQRLGDALPPAWEGADIRIEGVVAQLPQPYERSLRFEFDVERVLTPEAVVPARIALSWWGSTTGGGRAGSIPGLRAGERWQLTVRLRRPHGLHNPNGFDYEAWLLERNVRATGYVRAPGTARRLVATVWRPQYLVERLRETVRQRIERALPGADYAGVLTALAIGDQRAITPPQWQVFTRTGVNHLMSISGLHVTMISGLVFALAHFLWRRHAALMLRLPAPKAAAAAGLAAALAYAWLAGFAIPAQRTVYMLAAVALAVWSGRLTSASGVLCAALLAVVVIDPWAVLAAGFWLSFSAVALILLVATNRIGGLHWLPAWARVQGAITLGLTPLSVALFQQVSLVSPLANALAIPLVSLAIVPLTLAGVAIPGDFVLQFAHALMAVCGSALVWLSEFPAAVWQQHAPPWWAVGAALAGVVWMLLPRGFPARWLGVCACYPLFAVLPPPLPEGMLRMTVLDVGQGLAVVAQTREHALLFDSGPAFGPQADSGNRVIVPYLRASGVRVLDGMVISHGDKDHSGGAASVLAAVPVDRLWSSPGVALPAAGGTVPVVTCAAGERWRWNGVEFEMLHPPVVYQASEKRRSNDRSCVLKVSAGGEGVLLTADIEQKAERELVQTMPEKLRASLLLVPHHGSRTSSSELFLSAVNPRIALVAAGYRNRFGHPKDAVLDRFRSRGSKIYRTDLDGALSISISAEGAISVQRHRAIYRRYWHAALENPDLPDDEPGPDDD